MKKNAPFKTLSQKRNTINNKNASKTLFSRKLLQFKESLVTDELNSSKKK